MNTLSRIDSFIGRVVITQHSPRPSTPTGSPSPASSSSSLPSSAASSSFPAAPQPPTPPSGSPRRRLSTLPPRRRRRRRAPTSTTIKLPPPTTPLLLRIALALWSILLAFWRSLVGDTRAVRLRHQRGRRAAAVAAAESKVAEEDDRLGGVHGIGMGIGVAGLASSIAAAASAAAGGGLSSDEGDLSGSDAEASDREWVDPVTRASETTSLPSVPRDDEFGQRPEARPRTPTDTTFSFRLRSAQSKETVSITGTLDPSLQQPGAPAVTAPQPRPFSRTSPPQSILAPAQRRTTRLLPNPMATTLLDPSVPAVPHRSVTPTIPPVIRPHTPFHLQKTLILDLDETLIHSTSRPMGGGNTGTGLLGIPSGLSGRGRRRGEGHTVEVVLHGRSTTYHVYKRPYVDFFLKKVASWYTLVIYTASMPEYADPVIDWLDGGRGLFTKRLYRESCYLQQNGSYIKDLSLVEEDLGRVCFMDNSPISYSWNKANALPIEGWTSDPNDEALLQSIPVLDSLRFVTDVRRILGIRGFA
ncbi:Nuclear envelope morphology protein 1 [Vanrija albida]|uniref:Nuclear envelope morphology protein 1 n=1 Tax=Vanrija albida TaxID=181172 RepID=A0ABR3QDN0_9TREE